MNAYKITFNNGDSLITSMNKCQAVVESYYLGKVFNLGIEGDLMVEAVKVEAIL